MDGYCSQGSSRRAAIREGTASGEPIWPRLVAAPGGGTAPRGGPTAAAPPPPTGARTPPRGGGRRWRPGCRGSLHAEDRDQPGQVLGLLGQVRGGLGHLLHGGQVVAGDLGDVLHG